MKNNVSVNVEAKALHSQQALQPWEPCSLLPCPRDGARPEVGEYGCQAPDSQLTWWHPVCSRTIVHCSWELRLFTWSIEEQSGALGREYTQTRVLKKRDTHCADVAQ